MTEKRCSRCGEYKLFEEFNKNKSKKDRHQSICRSCQKDYKKDYRENNKEKIKEYNREYDRKRYENNRDQLLEQNRKYRQAHRERLIEYKVKYREINSERLKNYYETNRDRIAERTRKWYEANRDKITQNNRKWYEANRDKNAAKAARRRAREKSKATKDSWELQQISLFYQDCPEGYHVDHIIPLSKEGKHELSNLQHLEAYMNLSKHDKHPDDWDDPRPISCRA